MINKKESRHKAAAERQSACFLFHRARPASDYSSQMKKTIPLYRMSFVQFTQILYFIFIGLRIAESLYIFYNIKSYENDYMPRFLQRLTACLHLFE